MKIRLLKGMRATGVLSLFAQLSLLLLLACDAVRAEIPSNAYKYKAFYIKEIQREHGLNAPISMHFAMIHQESRWRPDVKSPVGAEGLAQFMPATRDWLPEITGRMSSFDSMDPKQSLRANAIYTKHLYDNVDTYNSECDRFAFVLSAYNGGIGWVYRDQKLSQCPGKWFGSVENVSNRSDAAKKENRHYVDVIINKFQHLYSKNGFGEGELCNF